MTEPTAPPDYYRDPAAPSTSADEAAGTQQAGGPSPSTVGASADEAGRDTTADTAKSEAARVKDSALQAGESVATTAKDEVADVAEEAKSQAKGLAQSAGVQLRDQVSTQQQRLADLVQGLAAELGGMASGSQQSGPLTDLAQRAAAKGDDVAHWLQSREPAEVLDEVTRFARRRPATFLALCVAAGVVAGRITRGAVALRSNSTADDSATPPATAPDDARALPAREVGLDSGGEDFDPRLLTDGTTTSYHSSDADPRIAEPQTVADAARQGYQSEQPALRSDEGRSVGELLSSVSANLSTLMRQEVALAKAEAKQTGARAGKGVGMFAGAGVAGFLFLMFLSISAWWGLGQFVGNAWSGLIVALVWAVVAAALAMSGKKKFDEMRGLERTAETLGKVPNAMKGHEEDNR